MRKVIKEGILATWRTCLGNLDPCVETKDGVVYFQLSDIGRGGLVWEYGGACNVGLLVDGRIPFDEFESMHSQIQNVCEEILEKYGNTEED